MEAQKSSKVYIALGSNMGNRYENLKKAIKAISALDNTKLIKSSNIYETEPVGYLAQDKFLNMVILVETNLNPLMLLRKLQEIENMLQRKRLIRWGPRTIDLDILLYDKLTINLPELQIPHPEMLKRAFVLIPLKDIEPDMEIYGKDIDRYIDACNDKIGVKHFKLFKD
ncbi:MAG TPA: 2-amino-4-hydroxy-6-hydroxymethyldihydropteridine diphosphokinase [Clostridiaceae bacterium]|nr:2-amino-4-hydroxy-6-hydroxymethyldihydropteridine diphosphokinase [Clostridiaceae bacterium]